jgi:hypothetical protein
MKNVSPRSLQLAQIREIKRTRLYGIGDTEQALTAIAMSAVKNTHVAKF